MGQTPDLEKALPQVNGRGSWTMTGNLLGMIGLDAVPLLGIATAGCGSADSQSRILEA